MPEGIADQQEQAAEASPADLICPHCGYDLRMIASDRCPECGATIDREAGTRPCLPWTYRRTRGRITAYLQTVWMITLGTRRLAAEQSRPVSYRDARRFWMTTTALVSIPAIAAFALAWIAERGMEIAFPNINNALVFATKVDDSSWHTYDVELPWLTGISIAPATMLFIGIAVATNLAIPSYFVTDRRQSAAERARAVSLSHYASGVMFWWPAISVASLAPALYLTFTSGATIDDRPVQSILAAGFWGSYGISLLIYWVRCVFLSARLTRGGFSTGFATAFLLPTAWSLNTALWGLVVPWLFGYLWLIAGAW